MSKKPELKIVVATPKQGDETPFYTTVGSGWTVEGKKGVFLALKVHPGIGLKGGLVKVIGDNTMPVLPSRLDLVVAESVEGRGDIYHCVGSAFAVKGGAMYNLSLPPEVTLSGKFMLFAPTEKGTK